MPTRFHRAIGAITATALAASVADAASTATTGIVAGVGLNAASGKTTISAGGGAIEATLLNTDAVVKAGRAIRILSIGAAGASQHKTVLVLGHGDALDLTMARYFQMRLRQLAIAGRNLGPCPPPKPSQVSSTQKGEQTFQALDNFFKSLAPAPSDLTAAIATDTTIQGIPLTTDERVLVDSIMMAAPRNAAWVDSDLLTYPAHTSAVPPDPTVTSQVAFKIPGDMADVSADTGLIKEFNDLQLEAMRKRTCGSDAAKQWLTEAQAFEAMATAGDKGAPPLAAAAELLSIADTGDYLVLRIAIEQSGGTAITRSNIFYTLGLPGAATVSAGLLVSFRLSDPANGTDVLTGFVRCAVRPTRFQDIHRLVASDPRYHVPADQVKCAVLTS